MSRSKNLNFTENGSAMTTLATQFRLAVSCLTPDEDAKSAKTAHTEVRDVLNADTKLQSLGISPILIGSYRRRTSIRRVKDVDVFARLQYATESTRPGKIMDHVGEVLEAAFEGRVLRQHRSFMIDFPDLDLSVDVVIARPCIKHPDNEHWQIPQKIEDDGRASWVETHPDKMTELTQTANKTFLLNDDDPTSGVYLDVVKLVRQIRRTWVDEQPGGYYFEVLTYHAFQDLSPSFGTLADYLTVILREIADRLPDYENSGPDDPTIDGEIIKTKATTEQVRSAAERIAEAAELAEDALNDDDPCSSALKWQKLLGETKNTKEPETVFAMPDCCTADGKKRLATGITPGYATPPAGTDRFA
jgi:hypothetical protein